jgi:hypothetical protein
MRAAKVRFRADYAGSQGEVQSGLSGAGVSGVGVQGLLLLRYLLRYY